MTGNRVASTTAWQGWARMNERQPHSYGSSTHPRACHCVVIVRHCLSLPQCECGEVRGMRGELPAEPRNLGKHTPRERTVLHSYYYKYRLTSTQAIDWWYWCGIGSLRS
jgi:hypothetical protein